MSKRNEYIASVDGKAHNSAVVIIAELEAKVTRFSGFISDNDMSCDYAEYEKECDDRLNYLQRQNIDEKEN